MMPYMVAWTQVPLSDVMQSVKGCGKLTPGLRAPFQGRLRCSCGLFCLSPGFLSPLPDMAMAGKQVAAVPTPPSENVAPAQRAPGVCMSALHFSLSGAVNLLNAPYYLPHTPRHIHTHTCTYARHCLVKRPLIRNDVYIFHGRRIVPL